MTRPSALTAAERELLELLEAPYTIYARPSKTKARDSLRRAGFIESYRPTLRSFGGRKRCWRATPAGRAALEGPRPDLKT